MQNPAEDDRFKIFVVVSCGFCNIIESLKKNFKGLESSLKQGLTGIHELHVTNF
jgi:hypothetical protein